MSYVSVFFLSLLCLSFLSRISNIAFKSASGFDPLAGARVFDNVVALSKPRRGLSHSLCGFVAAVIACMEGEHAHVCAKLAWGSGSQQYA